MLKKLTAFLLSLAILIPMIPMHGVRAEAITEVDSSLQASSTDYRNSEQAGDANGDGSVNRMDAILILQKEAGWNVQINDRVSDVNGDQNINRMDAILILQKEAGWNVEFVTPEDDLDPVTLRMWFHGSTVTPEASDRVMKELNQYLREKINVTLEPVWGTWGDFDQSVTDALAGGDDTDIYFTCNWSADEYNKYAAEGYWVKLDDMLPEYAPELLEVIPQNVWDCAVTDGFDGRGIYAVPGLKDTATQNCWDVNGTLLAAMGYDVDAVCSKGLDYYSPEFEEMLADSKYAMGDDFYPLLIEPAVLERMVTGSAIVNGDLWGANVLSYYYDPVHPSEDIGSDIECKYTTPEFARFAAKTYEYSQKGYINPGCQNTGSANDVRTAAQAEGNYLFGTQSYAFGCEEDFSKARGIDVRMVPTGAPYMDSTSGQGAMMAISAASPNKERALMFLNLLNTDPNVMTMLNYGLEGFTYDRNPDGTITFIDDARATYSPWTNGMGNIRLLPPTNAQGPDFWDRFSAYYDSAEVLPYGAFIFDNSKYDDIGDNISYICSRYAFNLMSGAVDPATELPAFLSELESAGIDEFVGAAQDQMAAYTGKEPPVTLRVWFHGSTVTPEASEMVMSDLNRYLRSKINVQLEPVWGTWGDFDASVTDALARGEGVDACFTCNWSADEYNKYAADGYWVKLDDMLPEYAPELLEVIPQDVWSCAVTDGFEGRGIYAVPALKDTATQNCWDVNGTLLSELGYDVDAVCAAGLDFYSPEFEEMMAKAKAAKGDDFYPLLIEPAVLERMVTNSSIVAGDLWGANVLSYYYDAEHPSLDIGSAIVNKYATPEFEKFADKIYEYSQKGYVNPGCQDPYTANDIRTAAQAEGNYLFGTQSYAFDCEIVFSSARGIDVRMVPTGTPYMDCSSAQGAMMAISAASHNKESTLKFLNLLNTDPNVMTMLNYGLEGFTYDRNPDGTITFIDDARATYSPWTNGMGNIRILPPTDMQGPDFWDCFSAYYNSAEVLPYGSFIFNSTDLWDENAALSDVCAKYAFNLMSGAVDPAAELPAFLSELESAGIDEFVGAAQKQMRDFIG